MKLGVMIEGQEDLDWTWWKRIVRAAEDLGYESLWRSDHFFSLGGARTQNALETYVSLVHVAENTQRIRFGPLVTSMTFRHPALVARMAAAIDQLSGGRLILGLGGGWNVPEHEAFGFELPAPRVRIERLEEGTRVIKALLSTEPVTFEGKHYRLKDAYLNPKPVQQPLPFLIGGGGEKRTLRVVARHADEWNMVGAPLETYRRKVRALEEHCAAEGRDPSTVARSLMCTYAIGETETEALRRIDAMRPAAARERDGPARIGLDALPWLAGTPSQLVEQLQQLEAEGVSRIMLQSRTLPDMEQVEAIAREVLPKVS